MLRRDGAWSARMRWLKWRMMMTWQNAARFAAAAAAPRFVRVGRWIRMSERRSTWWVSASNDSSSLAIVDWCCAETAVKREREAMKGRERERSEEGKREREARKGMSEKRIGFWWERG
jgi:hypothetical protein